MNRRALTLLHALLAASVILLFVDLGGSSIWDANEAFYVETPRQMVVTGDYVNPSFNGAGRFNKPVLSYWVVAGFYKLFGVSVAAERWAIALGALLLIGATYVIGRSMISHAGGIVAALILASAPRVVMWSRRIFIDIWLTTFLALALMCFVLARKHADKRRLWLAGMYVAMGLAVLTKGPVAVVLPGLALFVWLIWTRQLSAIRKLMIPAGLLIILAIILPWHIADYRQHGWAHIREFYIGENLGRYTETVGVQDRQWLFYIPVLLGDLFPWSLLLPAALIAAWRSKHDEIRRLMLVWIVVFVGVFSFSKTKQDLYIFPIVPALAVLMADAVLSAGRQRLTRWALMASALLLMLVGGFAIRIFGPWALFQGLPQAAIAGVVLIGGGFIALLIARRSSAISSFTALAVATIAVNWCLVLVVLRPFEQFKPVAPMTELIRARGSASAVVAHYQTVLPSMVYYLGRPIKEIYDMPALQRLVMETDELFIVIRPDQFELLRAEVGPNVATCIVDRRTPLYEAKPADLLRGVTQDLLLVGVKRACR
jgi:4-amino-4-deoxy-L-arabinose transferase-like glycosyltransferase